MSAKTETESSLPAEERFFINLDEDLSFDVEYEGFVFTLTMPDLISEAALSLKSVSVAQKMMSNTEYAELLTTIKFPRLKRDEPTGDKESKVDKFVVEELDLDLSKISHVRYALTQLPEEFLESVNQIAYYDIAVKNITYNGKEVWLNVDGKDKRINSFLDFVVYVRTKTVRFSTLIEVLYHRFNDWLTEVEITPQEVKN